MSEKKVLVEISARHVHVTQADLETLFGIGAVLHPKKNLSQPGQYASEEKVELVGPKSSIKNVSILGPCRNASQAEVSLTDARTLGVSALVRESGSIEETSGITLVGPAGSVVLSKGLIAAKRHIHLTPEVAAQFGVKNTQIVSVKVGANERSTTFGDVVIRISEKFAPAMHIDTDEANAAGLSGESWGEVVVE
ncbi:MAG: phosphate propanoyltransferase [Erysipelotrichaceae bacterium]|jgi:putative phosphotransacetylase|nr:phosphate propanoyltransferase [Erysipelotrichaceae bacterium]